MSFEPLSLLVLLAAMATDVDHLGAALEAQRRGGDPSVVMRHFDQAIEADPDNHQAYVAAGDYALSKRDFKIAGDKFQDGLKKFPDSADLQRGLAEAVLASSPADAMVLLQKNVLRYPTHLPSLMLLAEQQFDAEQIDAMEATLHQILTLQPNHGKAWALRAAQAYVRGDTQVGDAARERAMQPNPRSPIVDHFIGLKVARRYRREDAIAFQQRALKIDPDFHAAQLELAVNMLRLNRSAEEAWRIIQEVHRRILIT